jgi:hypothetical protein
LGEYLVSATAGENAFAQPEIVDLGESVAAEISLAMKEKPGAVLAGQLVDESGSTIPFGWLTVGDRTQSVQVSPINGRFLVRDVEGDQTVVNITAPGFWSQSNTLAEWAALSAEADGEITLTARSDNKEFAWGDGQIVAPHESVLVDSDAGLSLVRGWLWGRNNQPEPMAINMEGAQIEAETAVFALEYAPGEASWIYVTDGQVIYTSREGTATVVEAGEMMAFGDGVPAPYPVKSDALTIEILRGGRTPTVPLLYEKEPSVSQRLGATLASAGRNLSQALVAVTYLVMFLMIIGAILFGARRLIQARR